MNSVDTLEEQLYLESGFTKAIRAGEESFKDYAREVTDRVNGYPKRLISAIDEIQANLSQSPRLESWTDSIMKAVWPGRSAKPELEIRTAARRAAARAVVHHVLATWKHKDTNDFEKLISKNSAFSSSIKILVGGGDDLPIYSLHVELFRKTDSTDDYGVFYPNLLLNGATEFDSDFLGALQKAWEYSELGTRFHGWWGFKYAGTETKNQVNRKDFHRSKFSGASAQAATLVALLAASGDPYCEGTSATNWNLIDGTSPNAGEQIDATVAISATLSPELDASLTNPINSEGNVPGPLKRRLGFVGDEEQKKSSSIRFGLTSI